MKEKATVGELRPGDTFKFRFGLRSHVVQDVYMESHTTKTAKHANEETGFHRIYPIYTLRVETTKGKNLKVKEYKKVKITEREPNSPPSEYTKSRYQQFKSIYGPRDYSKED